MWGGAGGQIKLLKVATGSITLTLTHNRRSSIQSVDYSRYGLYIMSASTDHTLKIWGVGGWNIVHTLMHSGQIYSSSFSPDGRYIIAGADRVVLVSDPVVRVWEVRSGKLIHVLTGHSSVVLSVGYSPDGQYIVSGSSDNTIKIWDSRTGGRSPPDSHRS